MIYLILIIFTQTITFGAEYSIEDTYVEIGDNIYNPNFAEHVVNINEGIYHYPMFPKRPPVKSNTPEEIKETNALPSTITQEQPTAPEETSETNSSIPLIPLAIPLEKEDPTPAEQLANQINQTESATPLLVPLMVVEEEEEEEEIEEIPTPTIEELTGIQNLFADIQKGDIYKVLDSLSKGISPDSRDIYDLTNGMTPLLQATSHRRITITKMLLDYGADPNLSTHSLGVSNITPLMIAAQQGTLESVQSLVSSGANINTQTTGINSGSTALMTAIKNKRFDIVEFLISKGADINLATTSGEISNITPLMLAAQTGNLNIVKLLLKNKSIKTSEKDSLNRNVLVYAYLSGSIELIAYLGSVGISTDLTPEEIQKNAKNFM